MAPQGVQARIGTAGSGRDMAIEGKVAVITGSSSGIGLGIARVLASRGARIALNGSRDRPETHDLA
ncbi:MAG: SDR family NAD(P)-dependent oxidoreductase, partial [Myxococcota bacterium]